jgi:NAD(P)H-dependent flavin oxidoreductase YrpB (nitropropane dioxygenase family)
VDDRDPIEPEDAEVVDGLPVLASTAEEPHRDVAPAQAAGSGLATVVPSRQVAALAATGFVAGAATVALAHRRKTKSLTKKLRKKKGRTALGEVVTSNSFLVDVHLLRRD